MKKKFEEIVHAAETLEKHLLIVNVIVHLHHHQKDQLGEILRKHPSANEII